MTPTSHDEGKERESSVPVIDIIAGRVKQCPCVHQGQPYIACTSCFGEGIIRISPNGSHMAFYDAEKDSLTPSTQPPKEKEKQEEYDACVICASPYKCAHCDSLPPHPSSTPPSSEMVEVEEKHLLCKKCHKYYPEHVAHLCVPPTGDWRERWRIKLGDIALGTIIQDGLGEPIWKMPRDKMMEIVASELAATERRVKGEIAEKVKRMEKSLLEDFAYSGGDIPKKYVAFQGTKDLHYGTYNRAIKEILSLLSPSKE